MANQVILKYLKDNIGNFEYTILKQKLISSGYPEKEIDAAANELKLNNKKVSPSPNQNLRNDKNQGISEKKKGKMMKKAGIIGIILLVFFSIFIVMSIFSMFSPYSLLPANSKVLYSILTLIFSLVSSILLIFFFYGFVKMGDYKESKLLKIVSWIMIGVIILYLLISIVLSIISLVNGDSVGSMSSKSGGLVKALSFLIAGIVLISFVLLVLFNIGLIRSSKEIKYAKLTGIFGIVLSVGLGIYTSLPVLFDLASSSAVFLNIVNIIFLLLGLVYLVFLTLVLFNSSKKFE